MISDIEAEQLLVLIDKAVDPETGDGYPGDITLESFVEDLAMSMDPTTDNADRARANIQANLI